MQTHEEHFDKSCELRDNHWNSLEPVKMVNIKLLTIPELEYVINNGEEGRAKLAELFIAQGNPTWSTLTRASVV